MRVGLATDFYYPWIGGPAALVRNLAHGLIARGHSVALLAPSATGARGEEDEESLRITRARSVRSPFGYGLRVCLRPLQAASEWLEETRPDVVHVHHPFPLSAATVIAARRRGIPVAATNHTIPECSLWGVRNMPLVYWAADRAFSAWLVYLMNRCQAVATPTETAARALRQLGFRHEIATISNGLDTSRFSPGTDGGLRERLGLDDRAIVLYTGRLDAEKQMDVWLRAASHMLATSPLQCVIGGNGADRQRLEALAADLDIDNSVRFIGYLSEDELPSLYRLADVYLITSPVELQSITTLEAIASGLPVVAVRAGALPELVEDGHNGYCVPARDSEAAAAAVLRILASPETRKAMGAWSRSLAMRHNLEQSVAAYERFLDAVAHMERGGTRERSAPVGS